MMYDVIIVGAGPSGVFCAYELLEQMRGRTDKKILLLDQGRKVENRKCPSAIAGKCLHCKPCNITTGFSGAGAFSDGKLSLYNEKEEKIQVGGNLSEILGEEETRKLINYTDQIYLNFGADRKLEGIEHQSEIQQLRQRAKQHGIDLVNVPIRHLGTEKAHILFKELQDYLLASPIEIVFEQVVEDLIVEDNRIKGIIMEGKPIYAKRVVIAVGRQGAKWLADMCSKHKIACRAGAVDIGVRYELSNEVMEYVNKCMYEAKLIGKMHRYYDKVRTFCQNPSGFVSEEVYDDNIKLVNGHSYKERKSENTNLAILVSHKFAEPFENPIEYGRNIAKNLNKLGDGNIVVQRLGDIYEGKRTWPKELEKNLIKPTLKTAYAGDITYGIGYRTMANILEFIKCVDGIIPGFENLEHLLYAPEIKFYSNDVKVTKYLETSVRGLHCIGDAGGLTRGLTQSSCSGVKVARVIAQIFWA